jgi:drug/metabolite transporter (DMT)-like permease
MGVINARTLILLLSSICLGAGGQLMFKAASKRLPPFAELGLVKLVLTMFTTPMIVAGFACFFVSSLMWIVAIRSVPLSAAYPMVALSYIIIFFGSYYLFNEPLCWRHWVGALMIVGGIVLISWQR